MTLKQWENDRSIRYVSDGISPFSIANIEHNGRTASPVSKQSLFYSMIELRISAGSQQTTMSSISVCRYLSWVMNMIVSRRSAWSEAVNSKWRMQICTDRNDDTKWGLHYTNTSISDWWIAFWSEIRFILNISCTSTRLSISNYEKLGHSHPDSCSFSSHSSGVTWGSGLVSRESKHVYHDHDACAYLL